ncbi:hypothetical protein RJZ90_002649 [Blastomyces dermatitidis]
MWNREPGCSQLEKRSGVRCSGSSRLVSTACGYRQISPMGPTQHIEDLWSQLIALPSCKRRKWFGAQGCQVFPALEANIFQEREFNGLAWPDLLDSHILPFLKTHIPELRKYNESFNPASKDVLSTQHHNDS